MFSITVRYSGIVAPRIWVAKIAAFLEPLMATQGAAARHTGGHLYHREKRVETAQVGGLHGHTDDGQRREGGNNATQMSGLASRSDNHLDAAVGAGGSSPYHVPCQECDAPKR